MDLNKHAIGQYHELFGDSPAWGGVLKPNELESALASAKHHYYYDEDPDNAARYTQGIAKMGWRIAGSQVFQNGNKRVAYHLMQHALDQNGLGHLSPIEEGDPELVDHLIAQDSYTGDPNDRQRLEEEYLNMWRQRYAQGGPTPNYQQRYPEGTYITNPHQAVSKWQIVATQNDDAFFDDYIRLVLASEPPSLPPRSIRIGKTDAGWFETTPGVAHIHASGGTIDDRHFACLVVREQLAGHGIERAAYTFDWSQVDEKLRKEANWPDIEAKAKRLIQSGKVHMLRNSPEIIVAHVEGDHGDYTSEIQRTDPTSESIALWSCGCKWDQFAWQRTRQWKKYEGRVCAHVLATWWLAQSMPKDEEIGPTAEPQAPQGEPQPGAAPSPFAQVPGGGTGMVPPAGAPGPQQPGMQNQQAPMPPGAGQPPPGQAPELIPQYPMDPSLQPAINPVSVPGQKPQTPLNPIQNPGGTFSAVQPETMMQWRQTRRGTWQPIRKVRVLSTEGDVASVEGITRDEFRGTTYNISVAHLFPEGVIPEARTSAQQFTNGQMVQLKQEDVGQTVGLNSGQTATIPANSIGEVLGTDPLGLVNVYFAGPQAEAGILEPHGVTGWFWEKDLIPRPDIPAAGPAVRRR